MLYLREDKPSIPHPGYWDIFGGGINDGETPEEGIRREVMEEIEREIEDLKYLGKLIYKKDSLCNYDCEISMFAGKINYSLNKIKLNEGVKIGFFKFEDLFNIKIPKFCREYIIRKRKVLGL